MHSGKLPAGPEAGSRRGWWAFAAKSRRRLPPQAAAGGHSRRRPATRDGTSRRAALPPKQRIQEKARRKAGQFGKGACREIQRMLPARKRFIYARKRLA